MHPSPAKRSTAFPPASPASPASPTSSEGPLAASPSSSASSPVPTISSAVNPSDFAASPLTSRSPSPSVSAENSDPDLDPRTLTRREEAFTLYCQGYRSPAIASLLGVPQRTVRSWIAATLQATAEESRARRDQQLRLAIESQRAIVKAAWHAFDRAARAERLTLEHLQNAVPFNLDDDLIPDPLSATPSPRRERGQGVRTLPHLPTLGARYLQIVLHAQREIARLSGLYDLPASFFDPDAGRPMQLVISRNPNLPPDQMLAWVAFREQWDAAHPTNPIPSEDLVFPPDGAPHYDFTPDDDPDDPDDLDLYDQHPSRDDDPAASAREDMPVSLTASDSDEHQPEHSAAPSPEPCPSTAAPIEKAAETATPVSPSPDPLAITGADPALPHTPSAGVPAAIHPSLLPRFRHRGSRPIGPPLIRPGPGTS
jgi:hypothetical protein